MGIEIERKFLVDQELWRCQANSLQGIQFRQGYISSEQSATVRVRQEAAIAKLTIKGKTEGCSRAEFEYQIPWADGEYMLANLCQRPLIEKTRFCLEYQGLLWEVDEFSGDNHGLIVAEVELNSADQQVTLPPWVTQEVTDDARYFNVNLAKWPFTRWGAQS